MRNTQKNQSHPIADCAHGRSRSGKTLWSRGCWTSKRHMLRNSVNRALQLFFELSNSKSQCSSTVAYAKLFPFLASRLLVYICLCFIEEESVLETMEMAAEPSGFPIPSSLQDLEREPYNLLPYPHDFDDDDEAARANSFGALVDSLDEGNQALLSDGIALFQHYDGQTKWFHDGRVQALYTLVRYV